MTLLDDLLNRHQQRLHMTALAHHIDDWAMQVVTHTQTLVMVEFGTQLFERWDVAAPLRSWADDHAKQFDPQPYAAVVSMDVSPYVPPLRQVSAARQGAATWSHATPAAAPATQDIETMRRELEALGWTIS